MSTSRASEKAQAKHGEIERFEKENGIVCGNVHTASIRLPGYDYPAHFSGIVTTYGTMKDKKTVVREGRLLTEVKFNPNEYMGICQTLDGYNHVLKQVLSNMNFVGEYELYRIDFKIDCNPPPAFYDFWVKLNNLLVYAFIEFKRPKSGKRWIVHDPVTKEHEKTEASTKTYTVTSYNKRLQKPEENVDWRTEIKVHGLNGKYEKGYVDEAKALEKAKKMIQELPYRYGAAVETQTIALLNEFGKTQPIGGEKRNLHEFLRAHRESVFCPSQIEKFAKIAGGLTAEQAYQFRKNFIKRNPSVKLVTRDDLTMLCAAIAEMIGDYKTPLFARNQQAS